MAKEEGIGSIRALLQEKDNRSQTARLAVFLDEIEEVIAGGVQRKAILEKLHELGFTFTMSGFMTALHRVRKKKAKKEANASTLQTTPTQPTTAVLQPAASPTPVASPIPAAPAPISEKEEYKAFRESIKHLPARERRKKEEEYLSRKSR